MAVLNQVLVVLLLPWRQDVSAGLPGAELWVSADPLRVVFNQQLPW